MKKEKTLKMSVSAPWSKHFEDKKCRICGFADMSNINIFNDKVLRSKISTVFPVFLLHQDDPLPRNICRKCINTVSSMYNDVQKVIKLQNKWIQNVRVNEPQNKFLQALNLLEHSTEEIQKLIIATTDVTIPSETIKQLITTKLSELEKQRDICDPESSNSMPLNGDNLSSLSGKCDSSQIKIEPANAEEEGKNLNLSKISENKKSDSDSPSKKLSVTCRFCSLQFESLPRLSLHQSTHLRLRIPKLFQKKFLNKKLRRGRLIVINDRQSIRCLNCWRIFDDNKCILDHWSKAECEFYCQICGKEYEQSPKMLREHILDEHGVNYKSLKAQRDRLTKKIMSSSRSKRSDSSTHKNPRNKKEFSSSISSQVSHAQNNVEPSTLPQLSKVVTCRICSRTFQNFKACNSHMRAHKPPYSYGETAPLPDVDADAYMDTEPKDMEEKSESKKTVPPTTISSSVSKMPSIVATTPVIVSANSLVPHSTESRKSCEPVSSIDTKINTTQEATSSQPLTKMPTSTAPRGIRMKFVSRRSDLNGSGPSIKVKSLSDLQGGQYPLVIPNQKPVLTKVQNVLPSTSPSIPLNTSFHSRNIKDEPLDNMFL